MIVFDILTSFLNSLSFSLSLHNVNNSKLLKLQMISHPSLFFFLFFFFFFFFFFFPLLFFHFFSFMIRSNYTFSFLSLSLSLICVPIFHFFNYIFLKLYPYSSYFFNYFFSSSFLSLIYLFCQIVLSLLRQVCLFWLPTLPTCCMHKCWLMFYFSMNESLLAVVWINRLAQLQRWLFTFYFIFSIASMYNLCSLLLAVQLFSHLFVS